MASRPIRTNNAGDLRAPDEATGRRWWGRHGFVGLDKGGFAIFDTPEGGVAALKQQIEADQGRDQTQEEFINKYVGLETDPTGTANAQRNIPAITGARPDTALSAIDPDTLLRAIIQSEGGAESLKHFGYGDFREADKAPTQERLPAPQTPPPANIAAAALRGYDPEQIGNVIASGDIKSRFAQQDEDVLSQRMIADDLRRRSEVAAELQPAKPGFKPTPELVQEAHTGPALPPSADAEVDLPITTAEPQPLALQTRDNGWTGAGQRARQATAQTAPGQTLRLTGDAGGARQRTGGGNLLQSLGGLTADDVIAPEWAEEPAEEEVDIASRAALGQRVKSQRGGGTPMTTFQPDPYNPATTPRVTDIEGELEGQEKEDWLLAQGERPLFREGRDISIRGGAARERLETIAAEEEAQEAVDERMRPRVPIGEAEAEVPDDVDLMDVDLDVMDADMAPPEQRGLLGRLGKMISDNPEVAAQIAQAAGGLMSGIAGGRAQRKAGRETEQRVGRANLISALTGGRVRPQVTAAEADEGGLLSRLGQITTAGGKIATGEMERRRAEDVEERELGLKGRQVGAMERRIEVMQDKVTKEHEADLKAAELALKELTGADFEQVRAGIEDLNKATNLYKSGGYLDPTSGAKGLYGRMQTVWEVYEENPSAAGVGAIFQIYQRFFDPATVREGDLKILEMAQGPLNRLKASWERVQNKGGTLSSDVVKEMKDLAERTHQHDIEKAKGSVNAYIENAIAPKDRQATLEYYDRLFTVAPIAGAGGAAELTKALESGEIVLE
jgi:hypothetical protein